MNERNAYQRARVVDGATGHYVAGGFFHGERLARSHRFFLAGVALSNLAVHGYFVAGHMRNQSPTLN